MLLLLLLLFVASAFLRLGCDSIAAASHARPLLLLCRGINKSGTTYKLRDHGIIVSNPAQGKSSLSLRVCTPCDGDNACNPSFGRMGLGFSSNIAVHSGNSAPSAAVCCRYLFPSRPPVSGLSKCSSETMRGRAQPPFTIKKSENLRVNNLGKIFSCVPRDC